MQHPFLWEITEPSQVGAARRQAVALASYFGFSETKQGEVALIVTEAASNILRHATQGALCVRALEDDGETGIEVLALDKGPGMTSVARCLQDGFSTAGTAGNGLGAIDRLSHRLEIYSEPGNGTVLLSEIWSGKSAPGGNPPFHIGLVSRPKPGQEVCGDAWAVEQSPERSVFLVADGLGHGPDAAAASLEAAAVFRRNRDLGPSEIMEAMHRALGGTRGAAVAVTEILPAQQTVRFAGIGNISAAILAPTHNQSMVSHNGIVGHQVRKIQVFSYTWSADAILVMHSDGLSSRWRLDRYPGLIGRSPGLIAGVLYRDFQRDNDDATVLVAAATPSGENL